MAKYIVKLVDHADWDDAHRHGIEVAVQARFDEAFEGTSDSVDVSWGAGADTDNYVCHFVPDREHSILKQKWPRSATNPEAGGHTYTGERPLAGTEVYRTRHGSQFPYKSYATTVVHEAMHNLFPFQTTAFVHEMDGGGEAAGIAAAEYSLKTPMTEHNKQVIQQGFSVKNPQFF
jgi:hypothetical protein